MNIFTRIFLYQARRAAKNNAISLVLERSIDCFVITDFYRSQTNLLTKDIYLIQLTQNSFRVKMFDEANGKTKIFFLMYISVNLVKVEIVSLYHIDEILNTPRFTTRITSRYSSCQVKITMKSKKKYCFRLRHQLKRTMTR